MKNTRKIIIILALVVLFLIVTIFLLYRSNLSPVSRDDTLKKVTIESGLTSQKIGTLLEDNNLIKSDDFFLLYLKINHVNDLKAGTYKLSENMSLKEIVKILRDGNNYNEDSITITFKEGINFRDIARVIDSNTKNTYDDVLNTLLDKDYLNSLISDYWFITEDILDKDIYYPLEGYLFPDTYEFKNDEVSVHEIFKKLLDQMNIVLTPYKEEIEDSEFSIHELLTLASIAEKEVNNKNDRANVISVFMNRLDKNMSLGSDVTTRYGLKLDDMRALTKSEYNSNNAYNTRNVNMIGLPASPISTISKDSIIASLSNKETDYLYFISNIETDETFFFEKSSDFEKKKNELSKVNNGY